MNPNRLATNSQGSLASRQELAVNRSSQPLFDTALLTKHIESAYAAMWKRHQAALAPEHNLYSI
jgi:protein O-GlcNAc transferase